MDSRDDQPSGTESYKAWRRGYRLRSARGYVKNYPWSVLAVSLALGVIFAVMFRNVLAGVAGTTGTFAFGSWYWRPGGQARRKFGL